MTFFHVEISIRKTEKKNHGIVKAKKHDRLVGSRATANLSREKQHAPRRPF